MTPTTTDDPLDDGPPAVTDVSDFVAVVLTSDDTMIYDCRNSGAWIRSTAAVALRDAR
jgi:hypothetical protein